MFNNDQINLGKRLWESGGVQYSGVDWNGLNDFQKMKIVYLAVRVEDVLSREECGTSGVHRQ